MHTYQPILSLSLVPGLLANICHVFIALFWNPVEVGKIKNLGIMSSLLDVLDKNLEMIQPLEGVGFPRWPPGGHI
jgi:hypothetical protein